MNEKEFQIYRERAEGFLERLKNEFFYETVDLQAEVFHSVDPVPWAKRLEGSYVPAAEGDCWGGLWESAWFHITGKVPEAWAGEPVWFKLELGGEILIFDDGGVPFCGLTNTSVFAANYRKNLLEFTPKAQGGETVDFYAEVGGNGLLGDEITPGTDWRCEVGDIRHLKMGRFNVEAWNLANDFEVLLSLLRTLPEKSYRAVQLNMALNEAVSAYADDPANAAAAGVASLRSLRCGRPIRRSRPRRSATPISIRAGSGRCAKRSANARAPSRASFTTSSATRTMCSARRSRSFTRL